MVSSQNLLDLGMNCISAIQKYTAVLQGILLFCYSLAGKISVLDLTEISGGGVKIRFFT
jgi:hypothetical protein